MATRTFLALDINEAVRGRLASMMGELGVPGAKIKWVDPGNIHLTVKFLGDIEESNFPELSRLTADAARNVQAFDFNISGVSCIPPAGRIRMIWTGVRETTGRMGELYNKLNESLRQIGAKEENRQFKPHITLGRIKFLPEPERLRRLVQQFASEDFGTVRAEELVVYCSKLTPAGPVYTPIARAKLGK